MKVSRRRAMDSGLEICLSAALCYLVLSASLFPRATAGIASSDWPVNRGASSGDQYSYLKQINVSNVQTLRPAWQYHTGDASQRSTMYSNPIVVDGVMYVNSPTLRTIALDAATGRELWTFDPAKFNNGVVISLRNRGVTYWKGTQGARVFDFVRDRVYAIDAETGQIIKTFGTDGYIDLRKNLGVDPSVVALETTTPGAVYKNTLIVGSRVGETFGSSPGHIRAYDTITGKLKWIFHTIPDEGEVGHDTWEWVKGETYGGANPWGGITVDEKRGWIFAATGSATEDFYGGFRKGDDLFANCVLALDATNGKLKWYYQTVHHDLWDYDNPPAPILVTIRTGNTSRDAVVQFTKMGFTFVLDRDTGQPLFPVQNRAVAQSSVPGERTSSTQPFPVKPPPLVRQSLNESDLTNVTPESHEAAVEIFRKYQSGSMYLPPSLQGTLTTPGYYGGIEWSGGSFDPTSNIIYVNANEAPTVNKLHLLEPLPEGVKMTPAQLGHQLYEKTCVECHGSVRQGSPPLIPSLVGLKKSPDEIKAIVLQGRNVMPAFREFSPGELDQLVAYLSSNNDEATYAQQLQEVRRKVSSSSPDRYTNDGYPPFVDPYGAPIISPPWGTLNAIDLAKGEILWRVNLGEYPKLVAKGIRNTGTLTFGGPVATAGGVIFIASTADEKFRAFDERSGKMLWEYQLPAGGYATPSVYMVQGQEFVVIAAGGGGKNATKSGDSIIAFSLPSWKGIQ